MAGDWIKFEHSTLDKAEIHKMAMILSVSPNEVIGMCVRFWCWADSHMTNEHTGIEDTAILDSIVGREGFSEAAISVGWLRQKQRELVVCNFDYHMSQCAKKRALTARRVQTHRGKPPNDCNAPSVT